MSAKSPGQRVTPLKVEDDLTAAEALALYEVLRRNLHPDHDPEAYGRAYVKLRARAQEAVA